MTGRRPVTDRGMSESVQWALLTPLVLLSVLGLIQAGVLLHARTGVRQAALAAAETQSLLGADSDTASSTAHRVASGADVRDIRTTVVVNPDTVTVTVTGRARVFFDIGQSRVQATAIWPREAP